MKVGLFHNELPSSPLLVALDGYDPEHDHGSEGHVAEEDPNPQKHAEDEKHDPHEQGYLRNEHVEGGWKYLQQE
jgi:hypothetical protein